MCACACIFMCEYASLYLCEMYMRVKTHRHPFIYRQSKTSLGIRPIPALVSGLEIFYKLYKSSKSKGSACQEKLYLDSGWAPVKHLS